MSVGRTVTEAAHNITYTGFHERDAALANLLLGAGLSMLGTAAWLGHWTGIAAEVGLVLVGLEAHVLQTWDKAGRKLTQYEGLVAELEARKNEVDARIELARSAFTYLRTRAKALLLQEASQADVDEALTRLVARQAQLVALQALQRHLAELIARALDERLSEELTAMGIEEMRQRLLNEAGRRSEQ